MLPAGASKVIIKIASSEQQENLKNSRKTLKVLQQAATDKENLAGRPPNKSGKDALLNKPQQNEMIVNENSNLKRKKVTHSQSTQANSDNKITEEDLTSDSAPSEHYWELLAEKRRIALDETLHENRRLYERIQILEEENKISKEMLEESKSLCEVLTDMLNEIEQGDATVGEEATEEL